MFTEVPTFVLCFMVNKWCFRENCWSWGSESNLTPNSTSLLCHVASGPIGTHFPLHSGQGPQLGLWVIEVTLRFLLHALADHLLWRKQTQTNVLGEALGGEKRMERSEDFGALSCKSSFFLPSVNNPRSGCLWISNALVGFFSIKLWEASC